MDKISTINLLKELGLAPQKRFGQNFLISNSVSERITKVVIEDESELIYEIGAGLGALSEFLALSQKTIKLVEIDHGLAYYLKHHFEKYPHLEVIDQDILKVEFPPQKLSIVSNLPYYITTSIIEKVILENKEIVNFVFMVQSELSDRLFAETKSKEYGPLTILLKLTGTLKLILNVDQSAFYPVPHINSSVYVYKPKQHELDIQTFYKFIKAIFLMRRKTIANNLNTLVGDKQVTAQLLSIANIQENKRPEEIEADDYVRLFSHYQSLKSINK